MDLGKTTRSLQWLAVKKKTKFRTDGLGLNNEEGKQYDTNI